MPHRSSRRAALAAAVTVMVGLGSTPGVLADPPATPSLRLFSARDEVTVWRGEGQRIFLDALGLWVASVDGAFELRVSRPNYRSPVGIVQTDAEDGDILREVPTEVLDGWEGLDRFLRIKIVDQDGDPVASRSPTFCPNGWERQRVNDRGPAESVYPHMCKGHPVLTRGMVWGIDSGWAVNPLAAEVGYTTVRLPDGRYTARVLIRRTYRRRLEISLADAGVSVALRVRTSSDGGGPEPIPSEAEPDGSTGDESPGATVSSMANPDPDTLPDLRSLPAWSFDVRHRRGRDILTFAATEWNEGPAPLVVEGFRRAGEDVMDAYQYFYEDGEAVGRAKVGILEYHEGGGHDHWHFPYFAGYTLVDASRAKVARSHKQSWCLAPTDAIDLTVPGANWEEYGASLPSSCGSENAIWVRETLDAGWGDTYFQYVRGQGFDITDLPNGKYFVRVEVNPTGRLHDASTGNDVVYRRIYLRGVPGNRRVTVPLWHGIDTESAFGEPFAA